MQIDVNLPNETEILFDYGYINESGYPISRTTGQPADLTWISNPHWFKRDLILVLYVGEDEQIIDFLQQFLGDSFAGYRRE